MSVQSELPVLLDVAYGVGWITLNRPKAYNALNRDLAEGLLHALIRCDEDDTVRALVITGAGPSFCAGGDIRQMMEAVASDGHAATFLKTLTVSLHEAIATIAHMNKPVIMAVNGAAAGAGPPRFPTAETKTPRTEGPWALPGGRAEGENHHAGRPYGENLPRGRVPGALTA